jgi:hypothetical protein
MLFVEKHHSPDAKKVPSVATNFDDIKLIIINFTPLPSQKKPVWHLQKVEKKNTDQNPEFGPKPVS